ncbi:response regulator receiver protein [Anaeromyxobacter sp. K]|uniref:response regulator n=1 Tax=Anaeromyxobacter sp. (strain K) TaxID=447217 RepID=UPI00015F88FF|nr:response regulator [Anaeromyxobacter sp. K]ACG72060.1 response regulator receiver protein [Anaeromyxobacter sp. K]
MNGRSILLVEDDDAIRESVAECLDAEGYAVATVENGVAGLEWLRRSGRPDLVVLDLVMPVMNGAQFLEAVRGDPSLRDLPVVLMTAALPSAQLPVPVADGYLTKPFELEQLLETVARHARRR